jgi:hypothetical protein
VKWRTFLLARLPAVNAIRNQALGQAIKKREPFPVPA